MFDKLKEKWKVNSFQLLLIISTFALGGSLCGYAGRKILSIVFPEKDFFYYLLYVLIISILWPIAVIIVSIPLGQFSFFKNYLNRIFKRMGIRK